MKRKQIDICEGFHAECKKIKYRKVSPNWEFIKISENHIECINKYGGNIILTELGIKRRISNQKPKMIVIIKTRNGIEKKRLNSDTMKLLQYFVSYMRSHSTNN